MNTRDKINKSVQDLSSAMKDAIVSAISNAMSVNSLKLDNEQYKAVIQLACNAVESTYQNGNKTLMRSVDAALAVESTSKTLKKPEKKK